MCGDSAGGNLVLTTAYKAIEENIRVPDALLLAYPAVDLTKDTITPSRVMYINDVLVPYHALLLCHDSYFAVETHSKTKYHLCSPLYAPDQLLLKLPSLITIMTAGLDPLADDGLKLVRRLENLGKKVEHFHYRGVPHGFLNFGQVISMASDAKNKACEVLQEMIRKLEEN
uniref:Alpha/beta hydrolase fold-3 domain-containing protein n=1 Tax=Arcella intermedia TaxID=1963864 RepID=A0A6B2LIY1_9EUKA